MSSVRVYLGDNPKENFVLEALADGCDGDVCYLDDYEPSEVAVIFGTFKRYVPVSYRRGSIFHRQMAHGKDTVIVETGYINRGSGPENHYALGLNGINGRAFFNNKNSPSDRLLKLGVQIKPWRSEGEHILLCGQVPWDASVDIINFVEWTHKTASKIQKLSKRPIVYRPHPLAYTPTPEGCWKSQQPSLLDDLKNCWAVVTFNSNSAVEAAIQGIPVIACDAGSMASQIANALEDVEDPKTPDRTQWLSDLCYAQWTPQELKTGEPWSRLMSGR